MVSRSYYAGAQGYRYGFNGKENDRDVKGDGNQQDYGMRIYDPRLGRFLSVDPLRYDYPELTPYQFTSNSPIDGIDRDGLEHEDSKSIWDILWDAIFSTEKYKDGATKVLNGAAESAVAKTQQSDYHDVPQIPENIKRMWDQRKDLNGKVKMIEGTTDMVEATGEASANLIPAERILSGIKALGKGAPLLRKVNLKIAERITEKVLSPTQKKSILLALEHLKAKFAKASEFIRLESLSGNKDARAVGDIMAKIKAGERMDPIEIFEYKGKKYVLDGHHRLEAATRLGEEVEYKTLTLEEAKKYGYNSISEIQNAAADASVKKNKISTTLVNKIANGEGNQ